MRMSDPGKYIIVTVVCLSVVSVFFAALEGYNVLSSRIRASADSLDSLMSAYKRKNIPAKYRKKNVSTADLIKQYSGSDYNLIKDMIPAEYRNKKLNKSDLMKKYGGKDFDKIKDLIPPEYRKKLGR